MWTVYAQYVNSVYTVHNNKYCLPKSTNAGKKKKKPKSRKHELKNADAEPKRTHWLLKKDTGVDTCIRRFTNFINLIKLPPYQYFESLQLYISKDLKKNGAQRQQKQTI